MLSRRFVLTGLIAAPAVIAYDHLMPVRAAKLIVPETRLVKPVWRVSTLDSNGKSWTVRAVADWDRDNILDVDNVLDVTYKLEWVETESDVPRLIMPIPERSVG